MSRKSSSSVIPALDGRPVTTTSLDRLLMLLSSECTVSRTASRKSLSPFRTSLSARDSEMASPCALFIPVISESFALVGSICPPAPKLNFARCSRLLVRSASLFLISTSSTFIESMLLECLETSYCVFKSVPFPFNFGLRLVLQFVQVHPPPQQRRIGRNIMSHRSQGIRHEMWSRIYSIQEHLYQRPTC